jgi:DNA-directed RNA polymerase specialized sigma subunit
MVVVMKLKYVDELSGGRKRFRRRYPQAVAEVLGESVFQVAMKAREGAELFTEHAKLLAEFEKIVAKAKAKEVLELHADGMGGTEIAKRLGIGRASVYRILKEEAV